MNPEDTITSLMTAALASGNLILSVSQTTSMLGGTVLTVKTVRGERRISVKDLDKATVGDVAKMLE